MKKFKQVKIGQSFYTSNGKPSRKISKTMAVCLVPEYTGSDFQEVLIDNEFTQNDNDDVYGISDCF